MIASNDDGDVSLPCQLGWLVAVAVLHNQPCRSIRWSEAQQELDYELPGVEKQELVIGKTCSSKGVFRRVVLEPLIINAPH